MSKTDEFKINYRPIRLTKLLWQTDESECMYIEDFYYPCTQARPSAVPTSREFGKRIAATVGPGNFKHEYIASKQRAGQRLSIVYEQARTCPVFFHTREFSTSSSSRRKETNLNSESMTTTVTGKCKPCCHQEIEATKPGRRSQRLTGDGAVVAVDSCGPGPGHVLLDDPHDNRRRRLAVLLAGAEPHPPCAGRRRREPRQERPHPIAERPAAASRPLGTAEGEGPHVQRPRLCRHARPPRHRHRSGRGEKRGPIEAAA
jgi:hypothetical protein